MSTEAHQPDRTVSEGVPEALQADLRALYGADVVIPAGVDAKILSEARAGLARRRRFRVAWRGTLTAASAGAIAAMVLLAFRVAQLQPVPGRPAGPTGQAVVEIPRVTEDVDHSGKVDILDAFVVARLIEARAKIDKAYDVNGDGRIDQLDVDRIAMAAVETSRVEGRPIQ